MSENPPAPGVWVYCVGSHVDPARLSGVTGVGGGAVRTVAAAELVAVTSLVDLAEFGEDALRRDLEDLDHLEKIARAHHGVVEAAARLGTIIPTRLATVYRDDDRVRAMLAEHRSEFAGVLSRVHGRHEWGVKAYGERGGPDQAGAAVGSTSGPTGAGAGAAYLRRRQAQLSATEENRRAALASAEEVHATLSRIAAASRRHVPQDPTLTGDRGWMVLNGAYLVDDRHSEVFAAMVRAQSDRHRPIRLELTGPWPPYSFTSLAVDVDKGQEPSA